MPSPPRHQPHQSIPETAPDIHKRFNDSKRRGELQRRNAQQSTVSKDMGEDREASARLLGMPQTGRVAGEPPPPPPPPASAEVSPDPSAAPPLSTIVQRDESPRTRSPAATAGQLSPKHHHHSTPKSSRTPRPTNHDRPGDQQPPPHSQVQRPPQDKSRTLWQDSSSTSQPRQAQGAKGSQRNQNDTPVPPSNAPPSRAAPSQPTPISQHDPEVLIKQPETKPISQEQLIAEVKGIYAGLVMVESKCIEVDNAQSSNKDPSVKLNNEQWQALIALHRTLLHEHHDFFLASQHPSASPALRRLASKYAMPARMWRHGIHSFLELLRHRLPAAREHMLTFIYLAYSMMALLYETVPAFEDTWIECLGDLGRYRMAIEDDNMSDREVWTSVSRHWYSKASDKAPSTGRLYHHLAILARPNAMQQLFYYTKALCVAVPFVSARESILTLFDPVLNRTNNRLPPQDLNFVYVHAVLFKRLEEKHRVEMREAMDTFISGIDGQVARNGRRWLESGMHLGNSNCAAMVGYGDPENPIMADIKPGKESGKDDEADVPMRDASVAPSEAFATAVELACRTNQAVWSRLGDPSILAHLHVSLVFVYHLTFYPSALSYVSKQFPWRLLCVQLDTLVPATENTARFESDEFPRPAKGEAPRPLVEDHAMRGLLWTERYFPSNWFSNDQITDDDKWFEMPSFMDERRTRCLWLAVRIAQRADCIKYDPETRHFSPIAAEVDERRDEDVSTIGTFEETASGAVTPTTTTHSATIGDPMDFEEGESVSKHGIPGMVP